MSILTKKNPYSATLDYMINVDFYKIYYDENKKKSINAKYFIVFNSSQPIK